MFSQPGDTIDGVTAVNFDQIGTLLLSVGDEIKEVGLTALSADKVSAPRISEAQVSLECRFSQILELGAGEKLRTLIFGEVLLLHIKDDVWVNNKIDPCRLKGVGRLSRGAYCRTTDILKLGDPRS